MYRRRLNSLRIPFSCSEVRCYRANMTDGRPAWPAVQFADEFDAAALDTSVWVPHYLPAWSSRAASAAAYEVRDSSLRIPVDHPVWCEEQTTAPIRVSGIQSGRGPDPPEAPEGQQRSGPARPSARSSRHSGAGRLGGLDRDARRAVVSPRSMVSLWMVGSKRSWAQVVCVMEAFGDAVVPGVSPRRHGPAPVPR